MLAAIAIAPLSIVPVLALLFGPWAFSHGGASSLTGILWPALVVAYALVILFGLPMHLALVRAQRTRPRDYAIAGTLLGSVPVVGYVMVAVAFERNTAWGAALFRNLEWGAIGVVVFGLCAVAIALSFRAIAIRAFPS